MILQALYQLAQDEDLMSDPVGMLGRIWDFLGANAFEKQAEAVMGILDFNLYWRGVPLAARALNTAGVATRDQAVSWMPSTPKAHNVRISTMPP